MMKRKSICKAMYLSVTCILICFAMLLGTTYAWFTDEIVTGRNIIEAGNLDVELQYWDGTQYQTVDTDTELFDDETLWEPGHTEIVYLKISNAGNLACRYRLSPANCTETTGINKDGGVIALSELLVFEIVEIDAADVGKLRREEAIELAGSEPGIVCCQGYENAFESIDDDQYVALIAYLPHSVGNEANHNGTDVPKIEMGIVLRAWQKRYEEDSFGNEYDDFVARIGDDFYYTLEEAVEVANNREGGATVRLLEDVTLNHNMVISGDVQIRGEHSITRGKQDNGKWYTGTLFTVNENAKLTLGSCLVIDSANEWTFKKAEYEAALKETEQGYAAGITVTKYSGYAFATSQEGAPVATKPAFSVSGSLVLKRVTIRNQMGGGVVSLGATGSMTMHDGAWITHNARDTSATVVQMSVGAQLEINAGAKISGNYIADNGGVISNRGGLVTMNGGEISDNHGVNCNGTVMMLYTNNATFIMNGGMLCNNSSLIGKSNGRNGAIYLHNSGIMEMHGGIICHNVAYRVGAIDAYNSSGKLTITGGKVIHNRNLTNSGIHDVFEGYATVIIIGGTYTQDVSQWVDLENYEVIQSGEQYTVVEKTGKS